MPTPPGDAALRRLQEINDPEYDNTKAQVDMWMTLHLDHQWAHLKSTTQLKDWLPTSNQQGPLAHGSQRSARV